MAWWHRRACARRWRRRPRRPARRRAEAGGGRVVAMRTPVRHLPPAIERWISRMRWLRWLEALATAGVVWLMLALVIEHAQPVGLAVAALVVVGLAALV